MRCPRAQSCARVLPGWDQRCDCSREPGGTNAVLCSDSGFRPVQGGVDENVPGNLAREVQVPAHKERGETRPECRRRPRCRARSRAVRGAGRSRGGGRARKRCGADGRSLRRSRSSPGPGRSGESRESRGSRRRRRGGGAGTVRKRLRRLEGAEHHGRGLPAPDFRPVIFRAACRKLWASVTELPAAILFCAQGGSFSVSRPRGSGPGGAAGAPCAADTAVPARRKS